MNSLLMEAIKMALPKDDENMLDLLEEKESSEDTKTDSEETEGVETEDSSDEEVCSNKRKRDEEDEPDCVSETTTEASGDVSEEESEDDADSELCINSKKFKKLVKEILIDYEIVLGGEKIDITNYALSALQNAAEDYMVEVFKKSQALATHVDEENDTILPKDIRFTVEHMNRM